jgi:hypothetical protein
MTNDHNRTRLFGHRTIWGNALRQTDRLLGQANGNAVRRLRANSQGFARGNLLLNPMLDGSRGA